ncbi:unnamed protein product [Dracunculus medinensis]|uniref:CDC48_N domain-containing protein n=1 Tax=Dracunculus medinensis TaxID=318479 RepID=A0A0N4UN54_DRAME|nr:unnamed protein product [Dracunculus medinensis]
MSEKTRSAVIEWKAVNDRMAYARFERKFCNISVISVCAPILCADDCDKNKFYAELQPLTTSLSRGDMVIIEGDWNDTVKMNSIIGKYGIEVQCVNGECLLAEVHELFVINT